MNARGKGSHIFSGKKALLLVVLAVTALTTANAQDSTFVETDDYNSKILLLPAIGSSPETGFLFGAVVVPQFKFGGAGAETRSSSVLLSAIYTLKNQILLSVLPDIISPDEEWTMSGNYFANYFPESYWGVGYNTKETDEITALYTQINLEQDFLYRLKPGFFVGPNLRWSKVYNVSFEDKEEGEIAAPDITGSTGSTTAGVGWIARWDRRNSNMTPTRNHYIQLTLMGNPEWLGSTSAYTLYRVDARKYFDLSGDGRSVLALQGLVELNSGNPPFNDLSPVGGDRINRGYYSGRYRDQNSGQVQAEFRRHAIGKVGFTLFAGTGEVWDRFDRFTLANPKWTAGAGFRFNINEDDPTNIRVDFGISKESAGFYLQFGEAF